MSKEFDFYKGRLIKKIDRLNNRLHEINIGSDIDNTEVAATAYGVLMVNRMFGTSFKLSDLKYDFAIIDLIREYLPDVKDSEKTATDIWNSDEIVRRSLPMPGVLEVSRFLHRNKIDQIHRITSRPSRLRDATLFWYEVNMPWVDKSLIHIQPSGSEISTQFKIEQIKKYGINLFFEDSVKHAETISVETNATTILIPQDSNKDYKPDNGRIIVVPEDYYPLQPAFVRAYLRLAEVFS
jgi:uncharacterized HAD superfamily protein